MKVQRLKEIKKEIEKLIAERINKLTSVFENETGVYIDQIDVYVKRERRVGNISGKKSPLQSEVTITVDI